MAHCGAGSRRGPSLTESVSIVVLNWNRPEETVACLGSLAQLAYSSFSVIVVDNGSSDDSAVRIRSQFPDVTLVETGRNLGYGGGNNAGIRKAQKAGASYVWVLNNDTLVAPDSLRLLVEAAQERRSAGMIAPKILRKEPKGVIWYAGGAFDPRLAKVRRFGAGEFDRGQWDREGPVSFAPGTSLLLPREAIEQVGLFDEHFFLYWEDVEYCRRMVAAGREIYFVPAAVIWHTGGGSSDEPGGTSALFDYYNTRNLLWHLRGSLRSGPRLLAQTYTFGYLFRRAGTILANERGKREKLNALARGVRDGLFRVVPQSEHPPC